MPRPRAATALLPLVALTALVGCAADATEPVPSPSASASPSPAPSASPEPATRAELPVNCVNVLAPELTDRILALEGVGMSYYGGFVGEHPGPTFDDLTATDGVRSAGCWLRDDAGLHIELTY